MKIKSELIKEVRGKGLLNAIEINTNADITAWDICLELKNNGILAKPTHDNIIRLAPPLVINEKQIKKALQLIHKTFQSL